MKFLCILLIFFTFLSFSSEPTVVYGKDTRKDIYKTNKRTQKMASGVAVQVYSPRIELNGNTYKAIDVLALSERDGNNTPYCKEERFSHDPSLSECTGFLVADDILVTAGHCLVPSNVEIKNTVTGKCSAYKWIFDYKKDTEGKIDLNTISKNNVFECAEVLYGVRQIKFDRELDREVRGKDYAIIRLNRKTKNRFHAKLSRRQVGFFEKVFSISAPLGIPLKYLYKSFVFNFFDENKFTTNLDSFEGSSGSPIYSQETKEVVGVLGQGFTDYTVVKGEDGKACRKINRCNIIGNNCTITPRNKDLIDGEQAIHSKFIFEKLKEITKGYIELEGPF